MQGHRKLMTICAAAVLTLGLAACGGGGSDTVEAPPPMPAPEPEPTPYEVASAAIAAAGTEAEARAAVAAAVAAGITGAQLQSLNMAVAERVTMLAAAEAAAQRAALVAAAMCDAATEECLAAHNALVTALQGDVADLAADETATNAQQNAAQMALDEAEADRDAVQMAISEIDRTTVAGREVGEAMDAANGLETDRSAAAIAAAKVAIEEAEQAVGDDDSYDVRIAMAKTAVARAEERNAVDAAVMAAEAAATGLADDSSESAVTAAQGLVDDANTAIQGATHLTDAEKAAQTAKVTAAQGTVTVAKNANDAEAERIRLAEEKAAEEKAAEEAKALSDTAKALKAAINAPRTGTGGTGPVVVTPASIGIFDLDGAGDGTVDSAAIPLKKGASVGSLGSWSGTDYAGMVGTGDAKTTGMVRAYSNAEAAKSVSFTSEAGEAVHMLTRATGMPAGDYTLASGTADPASADPTVSTNIAGFPTTGTEAYDEDDTVMGTYMGASGIYKCVAATCESNAEGSAGIDLGTGWTFTPTSGAMLQDKDDSYLRFGWWYRKDKDGPTHAGAFYDGNGGATNLTALQAAVINGNDALVGEATYVGKAAGKFAISNPLRPANDNAGHFTANAKLTADFGTTSTLSGIIDAFRLNDGSDDPGWSVELQEADFATDRFATAADPDGDQTVWSVNGAKRGASGRWEAQMFDDKTDDSNVPSSVVGSFESHIGSTHSMVGAFGAEKE